MAPKPSDPLGILSKKCQVWWKTDQQWKLGRVNGYERSRNCYTIEYNGGFKEIDLVVVKHKEEDGMVQITKSYLLRFDPKDHTAKERKSQRTQFHPTFPIEKCGKCQMCVNPQMKQSCLFMRTAQIAHKRVYSAMVALERSRAIGKRVGVFWSHERKWYMAVITDFDPFTWRHQVLYDDGEVQDIRLIQEQVRHAYDDEKTLDRVKWYDAGLMEGLPSLAGMFRSRASGPALVGREVMLWNAGKLPRTKWQPVRVVGWDEQQSRHLVEEAGGGGPMPVDYTRHVLFAMDFDFCQKLLKEEEERDEEETSALMGRGRREPFWSSGPGTGADRVAKRPRTDVDPSAAPTLASLTALGLNPLVDVYRDASYEQVSQWVQEFLQCDDRVPATVRHLMGLHFSVRDRQALAEMRGEGRGGAEEGEGSGGEEAQMGALLAGLHRREAVAVGSSQALPLVKYGELSEDELADTERVAGTLAAGGHDLHVGWKSCQALINFVFPTTEAYKKDLRQLPPPTNENDLLAGPSGFRGEAASEGAGEESGDGRASMDVPTPVPPGMLAMRAL